jgi:hypothetical protein
MAQVLPDIFDVPDAGQSGEFALCRAGGGLYFAVIANKGDGGRLFVGPVGGQPATIDLGPLGVTGALSVRLDGHGPGGTLVAYIKRVIDTDGQDRGRRVITPIETGIAVGTQDDPVMPPAPPGGTVDPTPVLQAIAAARGPLDGKDAEFNTVAGVHNGANATYDRVGREADVLLNALDGVRALAAEAADGAFWARAATDTYGLPADLAAALGRESQRAVVVALIATLEYLLRLPAFPLADGTSILGRES